MTINRKSVFGHYKISLSRFFLVKLGTEVAYDKSSLGIDFWVTRSKVKVTVTINRKSVSGHYMTSLSRFFNET